MNLRVALPLCLCLCPTAAAQTSSRIGSAFEFRDLAPAVGLDHLGLGRGSAMVDFDGDGLLDLIVGSGEFAPDAAFRQRADRTFEDATETWSFPQSAETWCTVAADFDNDGDPDLFLATGGFGAPEANVVLRNDFSTTGGFTDVTLTSGAARVKTSVFGATALDYDGDGLLDVFLSDTYAKATTSTHLLRNEGNLFFRDVTAPSHVGKIGDFRHCEAGDFDNDGWIDVAVSAYASGPNLLLRNRGDGTFEDVAAATGTESIGFNFGMAFDDFDNDGWLDLYVPRHQGIVEQPSGILMNNGDGTYRDISEASGMTGQKDMGYNTGDLDADGYPDIFIGTGAPDVGAPDLLFKTRPGRGGLIHLTDVSHESGVSAAGLTRSHGSPFGDIDDDGDIDVYVNTGGMDPSGGDLEANILLVNRGNDRAWVALDLEGVLSNRSAVGARAVAEVLPLRSKKAVTSGEVTLREVHRHQTAGKGFGNTNSPTMHFGLGSDAIATEIRIHWPSGITQTIQRPALFRRHPVVETGIQPLSHSAPHAPGTLRIAGPAGRHVELHVASHAQAFPLKHLGGSETRVLRGRLDEHGRLAVPVADLRALVDPSDAAFAQAWVEPAPGQPGVLTNVVSLR